MALNRLQYNSIMRQYEDQQSHNRYEQEKRQREIYEKIPDFRHLEDKLASEMVRLTKLSLLNDNLPVSGADREQIIKDILEQKEVLLSSNGYPADYLELKYDCPDCKDTGYITPSEKCHCFKQRIIELLYSTSNLEGLLKHENFSTFSYAYYDDKHVDPLLRKTPLENIKRVVSEAKEFIEDFSKPYNRRNLLIYGNTGVGKTFLINCIAKELLNNFHTVLYLTAIRLFDLLERYKFSKDKEAFISDYDTILDCDLLIIDDLGTELSNAFTVSELYMCINERHIREKSTIISTNLSFDLLKEAYTERNFSRIVDNYRLLKIIGDDIRVGK